MSATGRSALSNVVRLTMRHAGASCQERTVPEETPVAFSFGGSTHAVMMASPMDLEDFARGFCITEGIVASVDEIGEICIEDHGAGLDIQIVLRDAANRRFETRRRRLAGPVGCGLCGIESIEEAMRSVPKVGSPAVFLSDKDVVQAVRLLSQMQPLHRQTGAAHAAGFYTPNSGIVMAREDVGRHNALDKLAGALALRDIKGKTGAVVITSRVSVEMIQKSAAIGTSFVIAVSAPTALAVRTAENAGITLIALVRGDEFDVFTFSQSIQVGAPIIVA